MSVGRPVPAKGCATCKDTLKPLPIRKPRLASCIVAAVFIPANLLERQKNYPVSLVPSLLFICWTVASLAALTSTDRFRKMVFGGAATASSNDGRVQQFNMPLPHIASHPLRGNGFATANKVVGFTNGFGFTVGSGHLSVVVDQGIPGPVFFIMMILSPILRSLRVAYSGRTIAFDKRILYLIGLSLLAFLINAFVLSQTENHGLMFLEVALYLAISSRHRVSVDIPASKSWPLSAPSFVPSK